jgi:integrase
VPLVLFLATTGCRKTEGIRVRWEGIDFVKGRIWVEPVDEDDDDGEVDWTPKDNEARPVPMAKVLRPFLEQLKRENDELDEPCPYVFATRSGTPYMKWPQKQFDAVRKAAGLEGGPHTLRHTYASHFLHAGGNIFHLAKILGQSQQRVTELYSHLLPGAIEAAQDKVTFEPGVKAEELAALVKAHNSGVQRKASATASEGEIR